MFDRTKVALGNLLDSLAPLISKVPLADLIAYIRRCYPELAPQLAHAPTSKDVVELIENKCSIINIVILEAIVQRFSITEAADYILAYKMSLEEFCENSLTMCCNVQLKPLSSSLLICDTIKFILEWKPDQRTLADIKALLWKAFKNSTKCVSVIVIKDDSSISVTCYAPHHLMDVLLVTVQDNVELLKDMGLTYLSIGYYTVYDKRIREKVSDI